MCCDGCPNSFHHACLEPPLDPEQDVEGEWFCPRCVTRRNQKNHKPPQIVTGLFGRICQQVDDVIPKAFSLPYDIREYFEGVKTGDEGEYEEIGLPRTQNNNPPKMNRAGFFDEPDYKATRDTKGNIITCYRCGLTSHGRDIIPCDYCPSRWHLDCLDPPLAVAPKRRFGDKPNHSWRCPLHSEHDLTNIGRNGAAAPGDLGRIPRLRKPKSAMAYDVSMTRGFRNNGIVEIELEKDDTDAELRQLEMQGRINRITERGVKLDFIDRVKRSWFEDQSFPRLLGVPKHPRTPMYRPDLTGLTSRLVLSDKQRLEDQLFTIEAEAMASANAVLRRKTLTEQQAALQLCELPRADGAFTGNKLMDLTNRLVVEAPFEVAQSIHNDETAELLALQKMVNARLATLGVMPEKGKPAPTVNGDAVQAPEEEAESDVEMDLGDE